MSCVYACRHAHLAHGLEELGRADDAVQVVPDWGRGRGVRGCAWGVHGVEERWLGMRCVRGELAGERRGLKKKIQEQEAEAEQEEEQDAPAFLMSASVRKAARWIRCVVGDRSSTLTRPMNSPSVSCLSLATLLCVYLFTSSMSTMRYS